MVSISSAYFLDQAGFGLLTVDEVVGKNWGKLCSWPPPPVAKQYCQHIFETLEVSICLQMTLERILQSYPDPAIEALCQTSHQWQCLDHIVDLTPGV
jgi:hypothetical protein